MLVLSMNPKRQRRPNVRLGEIGDVSAAFTCGFSQNAKEKSVHKKWKIDFVNPVETKHNPIYGFSSEQKSSEFTISDPGVSPRISVDMQQNRENNNPNSSKWAVESSSLDEIDMTRSKLNFSNITRKCRVMKRRGQSKRGNKSVFGSAWGSKLSPEFSGQDERQCGEKELDGYAFNICDDYCPGDGFKDPSDHETPATSKEACEFNVYEPIGGVQPQGNFGDYWNEDVCFEANDAFTKCDGVLDDMEFEGSDINCVRKWLEELGFGKYADVFEMHEVDEEALLLLTLEDLKEMGVFAVGPRRKLFTAIQQLRGGDVSS
ncbi:uncharacterized protein LOC107419052 [Ziziphus jujuba]|uniref:Uncharacterized protein LOC107419052 n=2 Tax=Ziziphus jujuba TaxID=326968 RepID=A0A6P3ZTH5_ZIZJJ|nr:uncharacterized protein LOC107419052 [Ziziphus jujuba]KAH7528909.1 hypothetical protein FEM48_Zijuj05G0127800 [Ziziphus jujuba var. spinosa]